MKRFSSILIFLLILLPAIPLAPFFAVSPTTPSYTHFIYMFAHANIFHWLFNAWGILIFHRIYNTTRCIAAYLTAVITSYILTPPSTFLPPPSSLHLQPSPVIGLSVITCFFVGFLGQYFYQRNTTALYQAAIFITIGFFIPNMAATYHLVAFLAGMAWFFFEKKFHS